MGGLDYHPDSHARPFSIFVGPTLYSILGEGIIKIGIGYGHKIAEFLYIMFIRYTCAHSVIYRLQSNEYSYKLNSKDILGKKLVHINILTLILRKSYQTWNLALIQTSTLGF